MNSQMPPSGTGLVDPAPEDCPWRLAAVPLGAERASSWQERARQWRALHDAPRFEEDGRAREARRSEKAARRMVSAHHSSQFGHIFSNKRVPRDVTAAAMGRYEADLIVITPRRIVNLEVKNWSGRLRVQGDRWVQLQRNGNEVVHDNLLAYNRDKLWAIHRYLFHCGVPLAPERFHQAVVFANDALDLDPAIAQHPAVLRMDSLASVLGNGTSAARQLAAKVLQWVAQADVASTLTEALLQVISPAQVKAAADAIGALRTWDRLTLHGGRVMQGDVIWLRLSGQHIAASALNPGGVAELKRRRDWPGFLTWVVLPKGAGTLEGYVVSGQHRLPGRKLPLDPDDCIYFHEPGNKSPGIIALRHVERMQLG